VTDTAAFSPPGDKAALEDGTDFTPNFDAHGLLPVVASSAETGKVLMLAYMNADALALTIQTGEAHYWSRSRKQLWRKGETSGNRQRVLEMRTDCDQDTLWLIVEMDGDGTACHTGHRSCFYRVVAEGEDPSAGPRLVFVADPEA
jgi:phosphoribosyl-AMP cyclohydrolase